MARKSELIITCNAEGVKNVMNFLAQKIDDIKQKMQDLNEQGSKHGWTDEMKKEFNQLEKEAAGIDNIRKQSEESMRKYGEVMQDLANSKLKEVKQAVREATAALNKMTENDPNRQKLTEDLAKLRNEIEIIGGKRRSLEEVKNDLQNLSNVRLDHLTKDLETVRAEYAKLSEAERTASTGQDLKTAEKRIQAQMAVTQYGRAGTADVNAMNAEQLKAEQARLRSAYLATDGAQGYETISKEYIDRLHEVNQQIQTLTQTERENDLVQKQSQQTTATLTKLFGNQKVTLSELQQTEKNLQEDIKRREGKNLSVVDQQALEHAKYQLEEVKKTINEISLQDIDFDNLDTAPTEKLEAALKSLEQQEKRLAGTQEREAKEVAEKKALIQQQIQRNKIATQDFAQAEKVAAEKGKYSAAQLQQAYDTLRIKLTNLATSEKRDIARTKEQMASLKKKIDEVTGSVKQQSTIWQTAVRNITAYVGVFGAFNFIKSKVTQVFESNKQLSDSLANIRKVSGLTSDEINQLYTNIAKIDTRNSVQQLNELAYAGAKLGVQEHGGVAALTGFVKAAEQVQMALGEDLGEEALPAMAKLTEVMGLMDQFGVEQAMQKAASAIFMLSTTSTSTGAQIIEFSKRLMGLANVSHITASELLALGSASDAMGLMAEVSSTAFNKVFTKIQSNTAAIEKAVGVAQGSLKSLVDEGKTMEAIVTVFEQMREMSMEEMQRRGIFTALGSDGARLNNVMTTMADRVDMLKKHLDMANKSFEEGEAVIAEYMIQNQTAAAYIERASNAFEKAFTNPEGVDAVTDLAKQWHDLATELTNSTLMMGSMKAALWLILQVVKGLIVILPTLIQFLLFKGALVAVTQMATGFWNMVMAIKAAVTASKALTAAQKWNGITTALSIAAALFMTIKSAMNEAAEAAERARQRQAELDKQFDASKDVINLATKKLEDYKKALDESNLSQDERDKRLRAYIKNEYQPYLDYLGIEIDKVEDLADAYAQVTFAMKQKAAAEEKQNFLNNANGENRNNRIAAQAELIREAKKMGVDIDKKWLESNWGGGASEIYNLIISKYQGSQYSESEGWKEVNAGGRKAYIAPAISKAAEEYFDAMKEETAVIKKTEEMFNAEYKDLDLENFSLEDFRKKQLEAQIQREKDRKKNVVLPPTKAELKEQREAERKEKEAIRKDLQDAKQESDAVISKIEEWYRLQETVITDMAADGKLTQEQAEQVIRTLNIAKNTALRDARLAISGRDTEAWDQTKQQIGDLMLDQGKWSQELLQQILNVSMESIRRNLANIDKGGGKYGITTTSLKDAVDKNAAGNQREIARLQNRSAQEVEKLLEKYQFVEVAIQSFSNRLAQMGILTETAQQMAEQLNDATLKGAINPNAGIAARAVAEAQRIQQEKAKREALTDFVKSGTAPYTVNPEDAKSLEEWFKTFIRNNEGAYRSWAEAFRADFDLWEKDSDKYKSDIQAFYFSLLQSEEEYFDARKKAYNKQKKDLEQMWEVSGQGEVFGNVQKQLDLRQRELALTGRDKGQQNMLMNAGFINLGEDPEIAQSILRMEQAQRELEMLRQVNAQKKLEGDELLAHNQLLHEKELALADAQMAMQEQLMKSINDRISKLQEWTAPIENFGTEVGKALYDQWHNGESMTAKWQDMLKSLALSWGQLTVKVTSELMMQKIKQQLINKAMQAEAASHQATMATIEQTGGQARQVVQQTTGQALVQGQQAVNTTLEVQEQAHNATMLSEDVGQAAAENPVNISRAAGKTLANLGWWGIPLVAVVTALLNMLLQAALGSSSKKSEAATKATDTATKTKIVSGMLTYDKGNVQYVAIPSQQQHRGLFSSRRLLYDDGTRQVYDRRQHRYLGNDGRVYLAEETPDPKDGLVTRPIATTVQGQPALVAEKGPEIVIGRETTRAIMLNEPELIRYIANYDRHGGKYGLQAMRAYDSGNVAQAAAVTVPDASASGNNDTIAQLSSVVAQLSATVQALQQKGVPAYIKKYGTGGLIEEVKSGLKFDKRYNG